MSGKTALVTGGAGYFGSLLVQKLVQQGYRVRSYDLNIADDFGSQIEQVQGDILDAEKVGRAMQGIDVVFHNVAQVPLAKDKHRFWQVNRDGTACLLDCAAKAGVKNLVYTSSSAIFGVPEKNPVSEATVPTPAEDYGRAKLAGEQLCLRAAETSDLQVQIIRPRTILGLGRLGIFQLLFEWVHRGYNIPVLGAGDNVYQFVHADDLADACIRASQTNSSGVYNCGTDRYSSMRATLEALCAYAKTGSHVRSIPEGLAVAGLKASHLLGLSPLGPYHWLMYGKSLYFDVSHAKMALNWQPRYSNEEMMIESYAFYVSHREAILSATGRSHHQSAVRSGILSLARFL